MRNSRILIGSLLVIFTLFLGINKVSASVQETFLRYSDMEKITLIDGLNSQLNSKYEIQMLATTTTTVSPYNSDEGCNGVLGPFKQDLEGILKIIRLLAPVFILFLCVYDYAAATLSKDAELLKKANSKLIKRLVLMAVLFFLPILLDLILGIIDTKYSSCID